MDSLPCSPDAMPLKRKCRVGQRAEGGAGPSSSPPPKSKRLSLYKKSSKSKRLSLSKKSSH